MKTHVLRARVLGAALTACWSLGGVVAAEPPAGIVGKNQWLFYRYELSDTADASATDQSVDLIRRFNKLLSARGVTLGVAMVPLKMRIYAQHLPDDVRLNPYVEGNYERMRRALVGAGVNVFDLNTAFLNSPTRNGPEPLFYRLDTHWSQSGAMLAAQTINAGIAATPALKKALAATPAAPYNVIQGSDKIASEARDLVGQLAPNAPSFAPEKVLPVSVRRSRPASDSLLGQRTPVGVSLLGSSYSRDWTGFADALRHTLGRDVLAIGVPADQGSWVGMESYLRDDAFQTQAPKLLIWEIPERDMRAPPDFKFREARYISDNTEWLLRVSAWVQGQCKPSAVQAKFAPTGLGASARSAKAGELFVGPTKEGDFVELVLDRPLEPLDYLALKTTLGGSKSLILEGSGPSGASRRFTLPMAGDDTPRSVRTPLPSGGGAGFTKVRLLPGKSSGFALHSVQVCRQPVDLLRN